MVGSKAQTGVAPAGVAFGRKLIDGVAAFMDERRIS
jgi:hypothetical protein